MIKREDLRNRIFFEHSNQSFERLALDVFRYQALENRLYSEWINALGTEVSKVNSWKDIPFMPISFFKSHRVISGLLDPELTFRSSGTTGSIPSIHYIYDANLYKESIIKGFSRVFGNPSGWNFLALLPSYLERQDSSLVHMMQVLMQESVQPVNGFFLHNYDELLSTLSRLYASHQKVWLIGVSFALLDFAAFRPPAWDNLVVIETGGMKGKRREMIRQELHEEIKKDWPLNSIESEYGMTELLSQAWTNKDGFFQTPPWMRISIKEPDDPFTESAIGNTGGVCITDLANLDSCAFISTSDLGKMLPHGGFEITGRFDNSDLRGCNLLAEI